MTMPNRLGEFNAKREALFRDLTLERATAHWEANGFPPATHWLQPLAAAHASRLQWLEATDVMLAESLQWLRDNRDLFPNLGAGAPPLTPITRDARRVQQGKAPLMGRQWR
jgi:hypothetical protein